MREFMDCINNSSTEISQCIIKSGDVIFSGIGTYFVGIVVSLVVFICLRFFKRSKGFVDKSTNIKQGGICNNMSLKFWNKNK